MLFRSGDSPYGIAAFFENGIYKAWGYESNKKENLFMEIKGKWWIKDGKLYNELTELIPPHPKFKPGKIVIDQIVEIKDNEMILIDPRGKKYKKTREK